MILVREKARNTSFGGNALYVGVLPPYFFVVSDQNRNSAVNQVIIFRTLLVASF